MAVGTKNPIILRGTEPGYDWVAVATKIAQWTELESNLITQSATTIYGQLSAGRNIVVFDGSDLIGFLTVYQLTDDPTWELGSVIVDPNRRGQKWGNELYNKEEIDRLHREIGGIIYSTTKTDAVKHRGPIAGLFETDFRKVPETSHIPLCRSASCFRQADGEPPGVCSQEHRRGGPCVLQRRVLSPNALV